MTEIGIQEAALVLGDLQEDGRYKAMDHAGDDPRFYQFRQAVERTQIRCLEMFPPNERTEPEIRGMLDTLRADCTDTLASFRPYIDRALAALDRK